MLDELIVALSQVSIPQENLVYEAAEERATFGLFSVVANNHLLTEGAEVDKQELRHGPYVSGYPIAEWLAWNWWRLRWEVGRPSDEAAACRWNFAHRMSTIGEGYAWPNITIFSDGVHSSLFSEPSRAPETTLFRYFGAPGCQTVPVASLETAIDGFVADVLTRLEGANVRETNLHRLWNELKMERADPELTRFRRLEAQLGYDPDEADEDAIRRRLDDAAELGEEALGEIAADATLGDDALSNMMSAGDFADIARRNGFEANLNNAITLGDMANLPQLGQVEAWRLGKRFAQGIRAQENLDGQPISDSTLADFAGSMRDAISRQSGHASTISFALDENDRRTRVSLRSRWETGQRFDLARLVGDRLLCNQINGSAEPLFPATRTSSYRQKMQRAFAAELLSPFSIVADMLGGDYSDEKQDEVAKYFDVSPMTIQTQLVNHRRIGLDDAPDIVDHSLYS